MNRVIVFFLTSPVFLFIRIIGVFSSGVDRGSRNNSCVRAHMDLSLTALADIGMQILRPIVALLRFSDAGDYFLLMDDNCRPHRVKVVEDFPLFEEGIVRME
ncbi:hypothetical protein TNCV_3115771 [Trichonephila clavipes]|nr:hypothetical protein TNCV_3115771 [Trichonephila clavipes]